MTEPSCSCAGRGWTLADARIVPCECGVYDPPKWVTRGDTACLIPHWRDPDRPRRASVGYVCGGHRDRIEQMLAELHGLHDDLALMLTASEKPDNDRVQSSREPGLNLNRKVVEARNAIHTACVQMVRWICEERPHIDPPGRWAMRPLPVGVHGPANVEWQDARTVAALATWLVGQVDWVCGQLNVDDEYATLDRISRDARRHAYPSGRHRVEVGACGEGDCPGTLWLTSSSDDIDDGRKMGCDDCQRVVEPRYWRRERRRIDGTDVNPWLTLAEAAVQYGTTTRTVERWVAKGRLKARGAPMRVKSSAVEALMSGFITSRSA